MQEHFIIEFWQDAASYTEAAVNGKAHYFFRVARKKIETVEKIAAGWIEQADSNGWQFLYPYFFSESGMYSICKSGEEEVILKSGRISDIKEKYNIQ